MNHRGHSGEPRVLSFAGCAWLFAYHFGVIRFLQENRRKEISRWRFAGASSGSVAALSLAAGVPAGDAFGLVLELAKESQARRLGPVGRMGRYLLHGLTTLTPKDAVKKASGRLTVSVTELPRLRNRLVTVSSDMSREELFLLIRASCYIPIYYERPVRMNGRFFIDGGLTNNLPSFGEGTVKVTPKASLHGPSHIFPKREPRLLHALFPDPEALRTLYGQGYRDAARFFSGTKE